MWWHAKEDNILWMGPNFTLPLNSQVFFKNLRVCLLEGVLEMMEN